MRLLAALVSVSSLLSGCIADDPTPPPIEPSGGPGGEVPPDVEPPEPAAFPNASFDGLLALSVGTPVASGNPGGDSKDFLFAFEAPANATTVTVVMTWTATQSTAQNLHLIVEQEDLTLVAEGSGASPLVVTFEKEDLAKLQTRTFAASGGLAKDQPFHLEVTYT